MQQPPLSIPKAGIAGVMEVRNDRFASVLHSAKHGEKVVTEEPLTPASGPKRSAPCRRGPRDPQHTSTTPEPRRWLTRLKLHLAIGSTSASSSGPTDALFGHGQAPGLLIARQ
jgi:hypothetical protein